MDDARRALRARLLAARDAADPATRAEWSASITASLLTLLVPFTGRILGFYWPHRSEYDPLPVANAVIAAGGRCALPVVVARRAPLEFREWHPAVEMMPGKLSYGIPHPAGGGAVIPDVLLIPLVGFDAKGYRLGYGGGYFDRTLAALDPRPRTIGVGFELGRLSSITPQSHDIPFDIFVTEKGIFPAG
jgi:5-formyltetrahydrofolate cyclo-ligase